MKLEYFNWAGYVSVGLWLLVPLLWTLHFKRRPRRWFCHVALAVAVFAYVFAKINSVTYVGRIQLDQSAEIAATQAKLASARKMAEQSRSGEVATVRFAEDAAGDSMDRGGMDEADLKYMDKISSDAPPAWKKNKKIRSAGGGDDSLEVAIGGKKTTEDGGGMVVAGNAEQKAPILMLEKDKDRANRLDGANLMLIRLLILMGLVLLVVDYLRRANIYAEAYLPLPVPGAWLNAWTEPPFCQRRPTPARRAMPEELAWLIKRGDSFVYMTDDPACADLVPAQLPRLGKRWRPVDVIRVKDENEIVSDEFMFEAVWYGRCSFVIDSPERASQALGQFMLFLEQRKASRATVAKTVHFVWDCRAPLDAEWQQEFAKLAGATGMSLMICD